MLQSDTRLWLVSLWLRSFTPWSYFFLGLTLREQHIAASIFFGPLYLGTLILAIVVCCLYNHWHFDFKATCRPQPALLPASDCHRPSILGPWDRITVFISYSAACITVYYYTATLPTACCKATLRLTQPSRDPVESQL